MKKSIFTKKHYEAIAKVLQEARSNPFKPFCTYGSEGTSKIAIYNIAQKLASLFEEDNNNFSKTKFEEAIAKEETSDEVIDEVIEARMEEQDVQEARREAWSTGEDRSNLFKEEAQNGNI